MKILVTKGVTGKKLVKLTDEDAEKQLRKGEIVHVRGNLYQTKVLAAARGELPVEEAKPKKKKAAKKKTTSKKGK